MKNHITYRFMPMIILSYLFINLYLTMIGATWCKSEGCEISKSLLKIEQSDLYTLAIVAFGILLFMGLKILKTNSEKLKELYKLGLFSIMICETIFLSYLYLKSGTLCISCFIFYILVILNYVIIDFKDKKVFIIFFIMIALSLLKLDVNTKSNPSISSKYTLLQSPTCEHCKKVKSFFKENSIAYTKEEYAKYSGLFSSLNITKIPVLIVKKNENNLLILNGVSEILGYFEENRSKKISSVNNKKPISSNSPISLNAKEGCEIDFLKNELENCND